MPFTRSKATMPATAATPCTPAKARKAGGAPHRVPITVLSLNDYLKQRNEVLDAYAHKVHAQKLELTHKLGVMQLLIDQAELDKVAHEVLVRQLRDEIQQLQERVPPGDQI